MPARFNGRPWCFVARVSGEEIDEIFEWINTNDIDGLCQGIMQGQFDMPDDINWYSVWSFGSDEERLMFMLRFSQDNS